MDYREILDFYKGKRVFITGHTGFKGSWLTHMLLGAGALVYGYSLSAPRGEDGLGRQMSLYDAARLDERENLVSVIADVRDASALKEAMANADPEFVIHMAAQPLVLTSYEDPAYTYETNVMGTVNLLEAVRACSGVRSLVNVTTDKVYMNDESGRAMDEEVRLDGFDPYSNSKSCSELVTACYRRSFFGEGSVAISTVRAGNVIGGGDFAKNRILPDCVRSAFAGKPISIRNPRSVRPYQHVLEPLFVYLAIMKAQYEDIGISGCYNVGPDEEDCLDTGTLADIFTQKWGGSLAWEDASVSGQPHEAGFLKLDCRRLRETFGWRSVWKAREAVEKIVEWSRIYLEGGDIPGVMDDQIQEFISCQNRAAQQD